MTDTVPPVTPQHRGIVPDANVDRILAALQGKEDAARHSDPRITTRYDRARGNLDRHANHTVAAFIAGGA